MGDKVKIDDMAKAIMAGLQEYADMADEIKRQSVDRITLKPRINPTLKIVNQ